jgi:hypothetical protein
MDRSDTRRGMVRIARDRQKLIREAVNPIRPKRGVTCAGSHA